MGWTAVAAPLRALMAEVEREAHAGGWVADCAPLLLTSGGPVAEASLP